MTTIRTLRKGIEENQKQAKAYLAKIIETLDEVPGEYVGELSVKLAQILDAARAKVRSIKEKSGRDIGNDTAIISTDRVALADPGKNGHNRVS